MTDKKQRTIHVVYRRQVSDGHFGTEAAEVSMEWFVDNDVDSEQDEDCAEEMLGHARDIVLRHLRGSLSENVKRAVMQKAPAMASAGAVAADPADDEDPF